MLFISLRGLLPDLLKTYLKGWVDMVKDQSCIPVSHQLKFVSRKINRRHWSSHLRSVSEMANMVASRNEKVYQQTKMNMYTQSTITLFYSCAAANGT